MPRNKHPEETIQKILDVSLKLFLEKGYEQTTILDIVDNLGGLTRGAFYHHFKSKEDVLNILLDRSFAENDPFETVKGMKGASGLEKVKMVFASSGNAKYPELTRAALSLMRHPRFLAEQLKNSKDTAKMLEPLLKEGMADGSIRPGNAKHLSEIVMLLANFWLIPSIFPSKDRAEFREKGLLIQQILDSLGLPAIDESILGQIDVMADVMGIPSGRKSTKKSCGEKK